MVFHTFTHYQWYPYPLIKLQNTMKNHKHKINKVAVNCLYLTYFSHLMHPFIHLLQGPTPTQMPSLTPVPTPAHTHRHPFKSKLKYYIKTYHPLSQLDIAQPITNPSYLYIFIYQYWKSKQHSKNQCKTADILQLRQWSVRADRLTFCTSAELSVKVIQTPKWWKLLQQPHIYKCLRILL